MRWFPTVTKVALLIGVLGFVLQWPIQGHNSIYLSWIALFGSLEIAMIPNVFRTWAGPVFVGGLAVVALAFFAEKFFTGP